MSDEVYFLTQADWAKVQRMLLGDECPEAIRHFVRDRGLSIGVGVWTEAFYMDWLEGRPDAFPKGSWSALSPFSEEALEATVAVNKLTLWLSQQ